jgi:hypothetical protein
LEVEAFAWVDKGKPEINFDLQTHHYTAAQMLMFGDDYKKYKKEILDTTNNFYVSVVNRLQSQYLFYMTVAWTMIIVINLSLILLVMVIKHKEIVRRRPARAPAKTPVTKKSIRK